MLFSAIVGKAQEVIHLFHRVKVFFLPYMIISNVYVGLSRQIVYNNDNYEHVKEIKICLL